VSVNATHGKVDVANFQLLSNTGTLPAEVQVFLVAAVPIAHQSLICFQSVQSNTAKFQSVEELGQTTSHTHCQSAQSLTVNVSSSQFVSVIVTVVIFQLLLLVILAIQFQAGHSCHSGQSSHCGHCSVVLASAKVTVCKLSLVNTISLPENAALTIEAQSVPSCPSCHGSHCSHFKLEYLAFLILLLSSLSAINITSSCAIVVFSSNHVGNIKFAIDIFFNYKKIILLVAIELMRLVFTYQQKYKLFRHLHYIRYYLHLVIQRYNLSSLSLVSNLFLP
jgi:hypothetical protein